MNTNVTLLHAMCMLSLLENFVVFEHPTKLLVKRVYSALLTRDMCGDHYFVCSRPISCWRLINAL